MKILIIIFINIFTYTSHLKAQTILGNLPLMANQPIKLEGYNGFNSYPISSTTIDEKGNFLLKYSKSDFGLGYLISSDERPLFVILSGEDIEIIGEALSYFETIKIQKGVENKLFEQYAQEHPIREQALSAWIYLKKLYSSDSLFSSQQILFNQINEEIQRIIKEDSSFLKMLSNESYVSWFLPIRKLISSISTVAQFRPEEISSTIDSLRNIDYSDQRLYKSGLLKDLIESHFWLIENSGKQLDSVFIEMQFSIDSLLQTLNKDEKKMNEITYYVFDLLEKRSLFQASEYLALKVLNEINCNIDNDLAKQLESYRVMKKGNIAPEIVFENSTYLKGVKHKEYKSLSNMNSSYYLIVFGASWCPKCEEVVPEIIENYQKWRNHGIEIIYVSLDTEPNVFLQSAVNYPFFTYCDFKKWESPIVKDYYIFGTPTLILLDNKREIVLRPNSVKHMDAWVDWFLAQGKN